MNTNNYFKEGINKDLNYQIKFLENVLMQNDMIKTALERAKILKIENYYLGAGCITQTIWNYLSNKPLNYGIKDIDFVYFDEENIDYDSENNIIIQVKELYKDLNIEVDVKNQARVHLWYHNHFGKTIYPHKSLEQAINTWPTTATAIGVRLSSNNELLVYAPFGLNDLFGKIVRANKGLITKEVYENKIKRWVSKWPDLTIIPWENS